MQLRVPRVLGAGPLPRGGQALDIPAGLPRAVGVPQPGLQRKLRRGESLHDAGQDPARVRALRCAEPDGGAAVVGKEGEAGGRLVTEEAGSHELHLEALDGASRSAGVQGESARVRAVLDGEAPGISRQAPLHPDHDDGPVTGADAETGPCVVLAAGHRLPLPPNT